MYDPTEVAETIKKISKKKNIVLKELLSDIGLNKNTLSNMYKGSMLKGDSLAKIADYLDCSVDYLLGRTNIPNVNQISSIEKLKTFPESQKLLSLFYELPTEKRESFLSYVQGYVDATKE